MAKPINFNLAPWQHWSKVKPTEVALLTENQQLTWFELSQKVNALAEDVDKASTIAFLANTNNHFSLLLNMLAAWQQGQATLLVNENLPEIDALLKRLSIKKKEKVKAQAKKKATQVAAFDMEKPLTLTLTSGSTGMPKAVVHNARQHLYSAAGLFDLMPFKQNHCWLLSLPLYHISGLAIVWRWLLAGARLKIANFQGDNLFTAIENVTHASFVPTQLQRLIEAKLDWSQHALQSVLLGGTKICPDLVQSAKALNIDCFCGYGMTEMASTISAKRADDIDSVGKSLPFRKLKLSANGEVLVGGQTCFMGYFQQGKLQQNTNDWFATKDLGKWLNNGELALVGRLDNMFISGGENIQPEEIEKVLSQFPKVGQVIVLPIKDKKWGEVPVALIENNVDKESFFSFAKKQLANFQIPKKLFIIPNECFQSGIKLSRVQLAQWLEKKQLDEK